MGEKVNKFYVYTDGFYFAKANTKTLKVSQTRGITNSSVCMNKKAAKSWENQYIINILI